MRRRRVPRKETETVWVKVARACGKDGLNEQWAACQVAPTLNVFDTMGDVRAVVLVGRRRRS